MITVKEAITNYRRIMMDTDIAYKDAGQVKGREKQVNIQVVDLNKAIAALKEVAVTLEDSLVAVLSPERAETKGQDKNPEESLCEHADFLRSTTSDIATITCDLADLIRRLEI